MIWEICLWRVSQSESDLRAAGMAGAAGTCAGNREFVSGLVGICGAAEPVGQVEVAAQRLGRLVAMAGAPQSGPEFGQRASVLERRAGRIGFLRVDLTATTFTGSYYQVPRPQDPYSKGAQLVDYFEYAWTTK